MPRTCVICKKGQLVGRNVSHANNKTRKVSLPNLHRTRVVIDGTVKRANVCTRCIRSGKAQKA
ncbi:MAG: 50S ribosomal protein L28 [Deltaproteobacteria bacterium]|jgi:large subunit ribosomal protein L28|nr:50S ribosomal protein L28 [Deltaproteobacteria bacterium]